jgi:hypothetical protein
VKNDKNFAGLDQMIATGTNFNRFLADVAKYQKQHEQEGADER